MSFILDALRKSEHERQRKLLPGLVETPRAKPRSVHLSTLVGVVAGLLVINTALIAYLLARRPSASAVVTAPAVGAAARPAVPAITTDPRDVRPLASENEPEPAPYRDVPLTAPSGVRATPPTPARRAETSPGRPGPTLPDPTPTPPSLRQLPPSVAGAIPPLHLDLHVYAADPQQRFVIISGHRAREGSALDGGVVVEQITAEGVILSQHGTRFVLGHE